MKNNFWYEAKPKPFDLPNDGEPVAFFKDKIHAEKYSMKLWPGLWEVNEMKSPALLEYIVSKENIPQASFKFESHAIKYNHEYFNGKGIISPNSN